MSSAPATALRELEAKAPTQFHYVLGFAFTRDHEGVLLIQKAKPKEQVGLLNGIGGKVEASDATSYDAMVREFREETGLTLTEWLKFATLHTPNVTMECFRTSSELLYQARMELNTECAEPVSMYAVSRVLRESYYATGKRKGVIVVERPTVWSTRELTRGHSCSEERSDNRAVYRRGWTMSQLIVIGPFAASVLTGTIALCGIGVGVALALKQNTEWGPLCTCGHHEMAHGKPSHLSTGVCCFRDCKCKAFVKAESQVVPEIGAISPNATLDDMIDDYRARLLMVSAFLCEPVSNRNLQDCRDLITPLYQDALRNLKARRDTVLPYITSRT
jgi:ADP-ribose pyrophosphatase YjhB (NUDIX family)